MNKFFLFTLPVLMFVGCGESPLTQAQKEQFKEVTDSVEDVRSAPIEAKRRQLAVSNAIIDQILNEVNEDSDASDLMAKQLKESQCKVEITGSGSAQGGSVDLQAGAEVEIKVSGDGCPISLHFYAKFEGSEDNVVGEYKFQYEVLDDSFKLLSDITALDLEGAFEIASNDTIFVTKGETKGSVVSQKHGELKIEMVMDIRVEVLSSGVVDVSGEAYLEIDFPGFTASLRATYDSGVVTYELNGVAVTEEEFNSYFDKMGINSGDPARY